LPRDRYAQRSGSVKPWVIAAGNYNRVGVLFFQHVGRRGIWRHAYACTVRADLGGYCPGDVGQKANLSLDRTSIAIGATVYCGAEEPVDQIAIAAMDLDAIEAALDR
jgi:hypothetical protein